MGIVTTDGSIAKGPYSDGNKSFTGCYTGEIYDLICLIGGTFSDHEGNTAKTMVLGNISLTCNLGLPLYTAVFFTNSCY